MARFLITAGPTREYLDGVRFLSNASSGRMGMALAEAILEAGHTVDLVVGPVEVAVPAGCEVVRVETTRQMYDATLARLEYADIVIAAAAVCDFRPAVLREGKLKKTGERLLLELVETEDILAEVCRRKEHRFVLGFALEAADGPAHARRKLRDKGCDAIVLNGPSAIGVDATSISLLTADGAGEWSLTGSKREVARRIVEWTLVQNTRGL
jgi:phosphopantothenoylcysteine decarboxylase / phosphopantothenate---cysteine ligase